TPRAARGSWGSRRGGRRALPRPRPPRARPRRRAALSASSSWILRPPCPVASERERDGVPSPSVRGPERACSARRALRHKPRRVDDNAAVRRRDFMAGAAAMGATLAWGAPPRPSRLRVQERRDLFAEGVASGDPAPDSVILWTRYAAGGD